MSKTITQSNLKPLAVNAKPRPLWMRLGSVVLLVLVLLLVDHLLYKPDRVAYDQYKR